MNDVLKDVKVTLTFEDGRSGANVTLTLGQINRFTDIFQRLCTESTGPHGPPHWPFIALDAYNELIKRPPDP